MVSRAVRNPGNTVFSFRRVNGVRGGVISLYNELVSYSQLWFINNCHLPKTLSAQRTTVLVRQHTLFYTLEMKYMPTSCRDHSL